jgi:hypothetical protein
VTSEKNDPLQSVREQVLKLIRQDYPTVERFCWEKGLNKATLSYFLRGKKDFQISTLVRIARALDREVVVRLQRPTR